MLSPSVWMDQINFQGDIIVINYLIAIISPCLETLQFIDLLYVTIKQFLIIMVKILTTLNNTAAGFKQ